MSVGNGIYHICVDLSFDGLFSQFIYIICLLILLNILCFFGTTDENQHIDNSYNIIYLFDLYEIAR